MLTVEPTATEAPRPLAGGSRVFPLRAAVVGLVGLVVLLIAMFAITPSMMSTVSRSFIAVLGGAMLWYGLQKIGAWKFGADFALGFWVALIFLALILFITIFADLLPLESYKAGPRDAIRRARPRLSFDEPLGRDTRGVSILSKVAFGGRVSLTIAFLAVGAGLVFGSVLGLISGWFKGWIETIINVYINSTLAFPPLVLLMVISAVFKPTVWSIGLGLAVVSVPTYSRIMRAQTISLREREFITAARAMGATGKRIMFKEILPNAVLPVASYAFIGAAVVIIAEGSLAFLGLSVPFPTPTWGALVADGESRLRQDPHISFVPGFVMFLTVLSFNRIGDWARKRVLGERNTLAN